MKLMNDSQLCRVLGRSRTESRIVNGYAVDIFNMFRKATPHWFGRVDRRNFSLKVYWNPFLYTHLAAGLTISPQQDRDTWTKQGAVIIGVCSWQRVW
jgi:hypothetical protein